MLTNDDGFLASTKPQNGYTAKTKKSVRNTKKTISTDTEIAINITDTQINY